MSDWQTPPGDDWTSIAHTVLTNAGRGDHPSLYPRVEIWQPGWEEPRVVNWGTMRPDANVFGLYWRPMY